MIRGEPRPARFPRSNLENRRRSRVSSITAFTRAYDFWYDRYQRYYREGLRLHCATTGVAFHETPMTRLSSLLRPTRGIRDRYLSRMPAKRALAALDGLARTLEGPVRTPSSLFHNAVGQYVVETDEGTCRICIDSADYPTLPSAELTSWSDLYFKSNAWESQTYPEHIRPLVNGDPSILGRLELLRSYRKQPKEWGLCFVTRVWGGRDAVEGIEHNLRLLEAVARARCSKTVIGVLVAGDVDTAARRLHRAGVSSRTRFVRPSALWDMMGRSRLNVIRLGMHHCIPWRVAGALATGGCLVFDQPPLARWPEPLVENVHFFSLGTDTVDAPVANAARYAEVPDRIEAWLSEPDSIESMMATNADYFDRFVHPLRVGATILAEAERWQTERSQSAP